MSFHHHHRQYFAHATTSNPCRCNFLGSLQTGILALKCTSTANLPRYWKHRHCEWVVGNLTTSPLPHMCHKYPSIADDDCLIKDWEVEEDEVTRQLIKLVNLIFTNPSQCHYRVVVDGGSSQRFLLAAAADWLTEADKTQLCWPIFCLFSINSRRGRHQQWSRSVLVDCYIAVWSVDKVLSCPGVNWNEKNWRTSFVIKNLLAFEIDLRVAI